MIKYLSLKVDIATSTTKYVQYASRRDISPYGEDTHTLRLTSKLVDLRVGYTKWIRRAKARRATSLKLRKYDAHWCIIFTEGYRSGHNEAVLKTRA